MEEGGSQGRKGGSREPKTHFPFFFCITTWKSFFSPFFVSLSTLPFTFFCFFFFLFLYKTAKFLSNRKEFLPDAKTFFSFLPPPTTRAPLLSSPLTHFIFFSFSSTFKRFCCFYFKFCKLAKLYKPKFRLSCEAKICFCMTKSIKISNFQPKI